MYDVSIYIKFIEDLDLDEDYSDIIEELVDESTLEIIDEPKIEESKHGLGKSIQFNLVSKSHDEINYYNLVKKWCESRCFNGWLRAYKDNNSSDELLDYNAQVFTRVTELSIGNFTDFKTYFCHINLKPKNCKRIILDFEHDMQKVTCYIITEDEWYKLLFGYTSVEGFVVGDIFDNDFTMYLPIRNPPKIWMITQDQIKEQVTRTYKMVPESKNWSPLRVEENTLKYVKWYRHNAVGTCNPATFGNCSVFQFAIGSSDDEKLPNNFFHTQVIAGFLKHRYTVYFSPIESETKPESDHFKETLIENLLRNSLPKHLSDKPECRFGVMYGIFMMVSKGSRFTDKFKLGSPVWVQLQALLKSLKHEEEVIPLIKAFGILCNRLDKRRFTDIARELEHLFEDERKTFYEKRDVLAEKTKNLKLVRRIMVTPSRILFQPPELNTTNRVLRQFDADNFVRVSFRDEDYSPLNLNLEYDCGNDNSVIRRISDYFHKGIQMGAKGRHFRFLGCSNSQLRSSGAWFVSGTSVEKIRDWIGDFTKEKNLAKYVARLGQAFTTTESMLINQAEELLIDDIETEDRKYVFSDGIGKISLPIAEKIQTEREMEYLPSAFQIRYGGCKGMVALDPVLDKNTSIIAIRPSMKKFESNHKDIEYCNASKPSLLYMNRQVVWLLRGYLVPCESFYNLQNDTLLQLANSLKDSAEASKRLMDYQGDGIFKQVLDSGIDLTQEPFHRLQLLALYKFMVKEVLDRTRIAMPGNIGRQMLGVMDETESLEYGQVFVQYSEDIAVPGKNKIILERELFITKNPCVHPGDLKKFTAVNIPALHHMCDVVVFPSKGKRPHPSELSGSDLDGDEYFVCWMDELMPRIPNKEPGNYEAPPAKLESEAILPKQLTDQVVKHITKPNNLGRISIAHQVHCDRDPNGVDCEKAVELAKQHSIAVDYPKTGVPEDFRKELRVYEYPDFMEKPDKPSYKSTSVVGNLYRLCRSLAHVLGEQDVVVDNTQIKPDPLLVYSGFKGYLERAIEHCTKYNEQLFSLMSQYGIENEGDIACGCLNTVKQSIDKDKKKNYDITEECVRFYRNLQSTYQKAFFSEFGTQKGQWKEDPDIQLECYKKASAWYLAAYKYAKRGDEVKIQLLSFPWSVGEVFCDLVRARRGSGGPIPTTLKSCTDQMIANMTHWFTNHLAELRDNPPESFSGVLEKMEHFGEEYNLTYLDHRGYGLTFNQNLVVYLTDSNKPGILSQLRQDLFEKYPDFDKSYLDVVSTRENYLAVRYTPNIYIINDADNFNKIYLIREYLRQYPELQVPSALVIRWAQINSLDSELHVLIHDFVVMFIMVMIMEKKIRMLTLTYPAHTDLTTYITLLNTPIPITSTETPTAAGYYLGFLKSIIYNTATQDMAKFKGLGKELKEMMMFICSRISSNSIKFGSYAMREYHEACFFLFNNVQDTSETMKRRNERAKVAKYKPNLVYPVAYEQNLCAQHLRKHANLTVSMRTTNMNRDEIILIEVWGITPEVIQDVIESIIFPRDAPEAEGIFIRNKYVGNTVRVTGSHRIYRDCPLENQYKDTVVSYQYVDKGGYPTVANFKVLDLPNDMNMIASLKMYLEMDRFGKMIRYHHNVYSHGPLSASCEFGRFDDYRNCTQKTPRGIGYKFPMMYRSDVNFDPIYKVLSGMCFKRGDDFTRTLYKCQKNKVPVTIHADVTQSRDIVLTKVTWAEITWFETHVFHDQDRENKRDFIFNIHTMPELTAAELKETNGWKEMDKNLPNILQLKSDQFGDYIDITERTLKDWRDDGDYREIVTEKGTSYVLDTTRSSKLSKVRIDHFTRTTKVYPRDRKRKPSTKKTYHVIAHLRNFDGQSIGLLNEFFEACLKLRMNNH